MPPVILISGASRGGKSRLAKALGEKFKSVSIVGQDDYWERFVSVNVRGKRHDSAEETKCTNWDELYGAVSAAVAESCRQSVPKSTDFGSVCVAFLELLVKTFRSFRLGSLDLVLGRQPYPQNTQRDTFSRP